MIGGAVPREQRVAGLDPVAEGVEVAGGPGDHQVRAARWPLRPKRRGAGILGPAGRGQLVDSVDPHPALGDPAFRRLPPHLVFPISRFYT